MRNTIALILTVICSCGTLSMEAKKLKAGIYRAVLKLNTAKGIELPFNYEWKYERKKPVMIIHNADERIRVDEIAQRGDSIIIQLPVFDTEFHCKQTDNGLAGFWINHYRTTAQRIAFSSVCGESHRFSPSQGLMKNVLLGKWEAEFSPGTSTASKALGLFQQVEGTDQVTGTFLTETGDYRYLEGMIKDSRLYLSAFDGSHAFLFIAQLTENKLQGQFFSGAHWQEDWVAIRNDNFSLRDAEQITSIRNPDLPFELSMKALDGNTVSLSDARYLNKPVIIQLMGSWCPNCMDESRYFTDLYKQYNSQGLEIIALAFEKTNDPQKVKQQVARLKEKLNISYVILLPLVSGKDKAGELLPRLSGITAFPTTLFLNRQHQVVKIHTGFSGPATGADYEVHKQRTENLIKHLLQE